jgi:hypothetical protein
MPLKTKFGRLMIPKTADQEGDDSISAEFNDNDDTEQADIPRSMRVIGSSSVVAGNPSYSCYHPRR